MIDFHTHILPNMDDGSDSVDTSIKLLSILEDEGVKLVCLTSHFYAEVESIDEYIKKRNNAFKQLNYHGNLKLKLGAEIRYYRGISINEEIDKLCLEGTRILLIELPFFEPITENIINEIIKLRLRGFDVVLAHIERYDIKDDRLDYLHNSGILFQMNTDNLIGYFNRKRAIKLIKNNYISFLGSDCHNLTTRIPNYKKAIDLLKKTLDFEHFEDFINKPYNYI